MCKETILNEQDFLRIFDEVLSLITDTNLEVREWAKKVDDLLKDVVYGSLIKNNPFDLDALLELICKKLNNTHNNEVLMVLIKWIEILHSITNVDILKCVPRFLERLLTIIDQKHKVSQTKHEVSKKALEQLTQFLDEFKQSGTRTMELDKEIMEKLLGYLLKR
mmetsp:Transcript_39951/g.38510  ORF Transcript_39951/g.38510 Transcript_39951/m.38510 type:complete len:164 (+) Transcript_39951:182-673(+)